MQFVVDVIKNRLDSIKQIVNLTMDDDWLKSDALDCCNDIYKYVLILANCQNQKDAS